MEYTFSDTEINGLIHIQSSIDISNKRGQLIQEIWKTSELPETQSFDNIIKDYKFPKNPPGTNLSYLGTSLAYVEFSKGTSINLYELKMEHGFNIKIFHLIPENKKNILMVYYGSHTPWLHTKPMLEFLEQGFDVVYIESPSGWGDANNNVSHVKTKKFGPIHIGGMSHDLYWLLESKEFSPIKFFLHPIAVILNRLTTENDYDRIAMTGFSGGGWATILYSAIDKRIQLSYPVAGSLPFFLMNRRPILTVNFGDYEYINPRIYHIANYLELYIMGSAEVDRRQIQILNTYDQCCFPGILGDHYKNIVENRVRKIGQGGSFKLYQDSSIVAHDYSDDAIDIIIKDINASL